MKIFYLLILSLFIGLQSSAQQYWPHAPTPYPKCTTMPTNCSVYAINDGDWNSGSTWSTGIPPTQDQIVCIPTGRKVNLSGIYNAPRLQIFVCGTLDFDFSSPGKLNLAQWSFIQVYSGGLINSRSGNAELISIGGIDVWRDNNSDINGPWVLSWPFIGAGVLTIGFDYFKIIQPQPYNVQLNWGTNFEVDSDIFTVERSNDQKTWNNIGSVKSFGNSSQKQAYSFVDKAPLSGTAYYRLKHIDLKGEATYSETIRFVTSINKNFSLFPNPVTSTTQLFAKEGFAAGQTILILDAKGMIVRRINPAGTNRQQLDLSNLAKGLYLVQIIDQTKVIEKISLIKQ